MARKNYSEADRILVFYSKDYGKVSLLAKSIRKPESRKRGSLEVFSHIKFSAAKGKSLDILTEVETIKNYEKVRKDLRKVAVAYYIMEVVNRIAHDEDANKELFSLILKNLRDLGDSDSLRKLKEDFLFKILVLLGYWPDDKPMTDPDEVLEETIERQMTSARVGKKILK